MPIVLPYLMIATLLSAMVIIKLAIAPYIMGQYGWFGVAATLLALLAFARWLDD